MVRTERCEMGRVMHAIIPLRILWAFVIGAILALVISIAAPAPAASAPPTAVDFTVHEVLPIDGTPGVIVAGDTGRIMLAG